MRFQLPGVISKSFSNNILSNLIRNNNMVVVEKTWSFHMTFFFSYCSFIEYAEKGQD